MAEVKLLVRLETRIDNLHAGLLRGAAEVETFGKNVQRTLVTTAKSSRQFQHDLAIGMAATGGAIALGFGLATKGAIEFERAMRNIATIATNKQGLSLTAREFNELGNTIRDLSTRVPQSAQILAEAMYEIVSTGFQGEEAMQVLKASAIAASAGLTDAGTAASGIVTVLKAYGLNGYHAAQVSNVLFQAVNLGAFSFEALASNMGQFVALASTMNVPIEDAAAAMATISLAGHDAATSATLLNRVFTAFINPSDALAQKMGALGISIQQLSEVGGLQKALDALSGSVKGNAAALQAFFPDVRELNGVLALTANEGSNAAAVLETFHNPLKIATAAQNAFNEQAKSTAFRMSIAKNEVAALGLELGNSLLPVVGNVAGFFGDLLAAVGLLPGPIKGFVVIATGAVAITTLLGATALFAVPKIAAFQAALAALGKTGTKTAVELTATTAVINATGNAAARGGVQSVLSNLAGGGGGRLGGALATGGGAAATGGSGALGALGGLGLVGGAAALAPIAFGVWQIGSAFADMGREAREAKKATDDFYDAIQQQAHGVKNATDAAIQNQLVSKGMVDTINAYKFSLTDVQAALNGDEKARQRVTSSVQEQQKALRELWSENQQRPDPAKKDRIESSMGDLSKFARDFENYTKANATARERAKEYRSELEQLAAAGNLHAQAELAAMNATDAAARAMDDGALSADNFAARLQAATAMQQSLFRSLQQGAAKMPDVFKQTAGGGGGGGAGKSAQQRAQDVARANLGIEQSARGVAQAVQRVTDAEKALAVARDQAAQRQAVQKAERDIAASYASSQRAVYALKNAEQALEDARQNKQSGRSSQEAMIAVQRARAQAQDAAEAVAAAQEALTNAEDGGDTQEIARAQRAMVLARADLREATWGAQDAQKALNRAREDGGTIDVNLAIAQLDVDDAQRAIAESGDAAASAARTLADAQEALVNNQAVIDAQNNLIDANLALKGAILSVVDAGLALTAAQKDTSGSSAAAGGSERVKKSLKEYSDELKKSNIEQAQWAQDLANIARDPNLGGRVVADELAKMGRDGAAYVHEMATSTSTDVQEMRDNLRTHAALASNEFNFEMATGMSAAKEAMGAVLTAMALETGMGVDEIVRLLDALGLKFQDVANMPLTPGATPTPAELKARGVPTYIDKVPTTNNNGRSRGVAGGDVMNQHRPEIAAGGAMRVWAEPETKGESYIPHANDWRRPQAIKYWEQTGRILGVYAGGGINLSALRPNPADFERLRLVPMRGTAYRAATTAWTNLGTNLSSRGFTTYAGGGMTAGGGSGGQTVVYSPGAVRVEVRVAANVDKGAVGAIVEGAVSSALGKHTQDLRQLLATR